MASLEDGRKPGLPPPPAPTRRGANPWRLSDTARKRQSPPPQDGPSLLEGLMADAHAGQAAEPGRAPPAPDDETPPIAAGRRAGFGLLPLILLGMAVVVVLRMLMKARGTGDWIGLIAPLLAILFVAHGWWRLRQRRKESK